MQMFFNLFHCNLPISDFSALFLTKYLSITCYVEFIKLIPNVIQVKTSLEIS
jgi:hypothetical protein